MKIGKNMIVAIMITFCFTATLFLVIPIKSTTSPYDPWVDINDDGKISLQDLVLLANSYGTTGTPINKTALLLNLQEEIDALNSTILEQQNTINNLNSTLIELENTTNYLNTTVTNLSKASARNLILGITPAIGAGRWFNNSYAADNNDTT